MSKQTRGYYAVSVKFWEVGFFVHAENKLDARHKVHREINLNYEKGSEDWFKLRDITAGRLDLDETESDIPDAIR